jgi:hypothetical protein
MQLLWQKKHMSRQAAHGYAPRAPGRLMAEGHGSDALFNPSHLWQSQDAGLITRQV